MKFHPTYGSYFTPFIIWIRGPPCSFWMAYAIAASPTRKWSQACLWHRYSVQGQLIFRWITAVNRVQFEKLGNYTILYICSTENFEFHENSEVVVFWVPKRVFFGKKAVFWIRLCFHKMMVLLVLGSTVKWCASTAKTNQWEFPKDIRPLSRYSLLTIMNPQ